MKFVASYGDGKIIAIEREPLIEAISLYKKGLILMASATLSEAYARVYHASREMSMPEVWVAGEDELDLPFTPGKAVLILGFLFPENEERGEMPVGVITFDPHPVLHTPLLVVSPSAEGLK
jgi:hypothetical protein